MEQSWHKIVYKCNNHFVPACVKNADIFFWTILLVSFSFLRCSFSSLFFCVMLWIDDFVKVLLIICYFSYCLFLISSNIPWTSLPNNCWSWARNTFCCISFWNSHFSNISCTITSKWLLSGMLYTISFIVAHNSCFSWFWGVHCLNNNRPPSKNCSNLPATIIS